VSLPAEPLSTREEVWARALALERAGDFLAAAQAIAGLIEEDLAQGKSSNLYLVERVAANLGRARRPAAALQLLAGLEGHVRARGDESGHFAVLLQLVDLCVGAGELDSAAGFFGELSDDQGPLGSWDAVTPEEQQARLRRLRFSRLGAPELALLRGKAGLTHVRLWASEGRYRPAIAAARVARDDLALAARERWQPRTERLLSTLRLESALFMAELHLDRGTPDEAAWISSSSSDARSDERWQTLRLRADLMLGRFSEARRAAEQLLARKPDEPLPPRALIGVWVAASGLLLLNRTLDAERILDHTEALLSSSTARRDPRVQAWSDRIAGLRDQIERKRRGAAEDWLPPSLPEEERPLASPPRQAADGWLEPGRAVVPLAGRPERFAQRWAAAANVVLSLVAERRLAEAPPALAALEAMAARTDAPRLRARTRYVTGLALLAAGQPLPAIEPLATAAEDAVAAGLWLDEWQARHALTTAFLRAGRTAEGDAEALRAKGILDQQVALMDREDAIRFVVDKTTAQDRYLSARVRTSPAVARVPEGWRGLVPRWRRSRVTVSLLREVECLTGWELDQRLSLPATRDPVAAPPPDGLTPPDQASTGSEIERWIGAQLALERQSLPLRRNSAAAAWPWRTPGRTAIVQFHTLPDRLLVIVLTRWSARLWQIPCSRLELRDAIETALDDILAGGDGGPDGTRSLAALAQLIGLESWLCGLSTRIDRLVIVPHDALCHLPFAALPLGAGRVCGRFTTTLLPHARELRPRRGRPLRGKISAVAVGAYDQPRFDPLPHAFAEAQAVLAATGGGTLLTDEQATPEAVRHVLGQSMWAHIVCHGDLRPEDPHAAQLVLYGDGRLALPTLQTDAHTQLRGLVLAACSLAGMRVLPGNELVGLPAALLRSGVGGVVAPLWSISDRATADFFAEVYASATKTNFAHALGATQSAWAAAGKPPSLWAPFVVYGEP
jgi:CHAT domain-containing protein